jgi:hypothetical protein
LRRLNLNVHFLKCEDETYEQKFNRLLADGTIVKRGLKADAKIFSELVFDVNTDYFERSARRAADCTAQARRTPR